MKSFSNTYIFIFSAVVVVIVAALLSVVALQLKPVQQKNIRVEKMQNILKSVRIESTKKNAEDLFRRYVTDSYVVNEKAEKLDGEVALEVDLKKEVAKIDQIKKLNALLKERRVSPFRKFLSGMINFEQVNRTTVKKDISTINNERKLPVFIMDKEGVTYYVFPLQGKGLWGPIWGFISLESDMNTVYGAVFDHKTETPGLGAEIAQDWFAANFQGKKLYEDGHFVSVAVVKGGTDASNPYGVDAISGGTITSKGVEAMLYDCLSSYETYFAKQRD